MSQHRFSLHRMAAATALACFAFAAQADVSAASPTAWVQSSATAVEAKVIEWRRGVVRERLHSGQEAERRTAH